MNCLYAGLFASSLYSRQVHHKIQNNMSFLNCLTISIDIHSIGHTVWSPEHFKHSVFLQDSSNCNTIIRSEQFKKWQNNLSSPLFAPRKHKELHLIDQRFTVKVRGVVEDCMSNPRCLIITYLKDIEKTILTLLIRSSIQWRMIHCQVKDLPQSLDILCTYLSKISKGIQFTK